MWRPLLLLAVAISHTDEEWRSLLGFERYRVMRRKATERAFSGEHLHRTEPGTYACAACAQPLFDSEAKYHSGNGWPSFTHPISPSQITLKEDWSLPFLRTEILCASCNSHLGHLFQDGPEPTHLRYTVNSISLSFNKR